MQSADLRFGKPAEIEPVTVPRDAGDHAELIARPPYPQRDQRPRRTAILNTGGSLVEV
jgi:hypothetical protein